MPQDRVSQADRHEVIGGETSFRRWSVFRFAQVTLAVGATLRVDIDPFPALRADFVIWPLPGNSIDDTEEIAHGKNHDNHPKSRMGRRVLMTTRFFQDTGAYQHKSEKRITAITSAEFFGKRIFSGHRPSPLHDCYLSISAFIVVSCLCDDLNLRRKKHRPLHSC